jgi:hypothetical protein
MISRHPQMGLGGTGSGARDLERFPQPAAEPAQLRRQPRQVPRHGVRQDRAGVVLGARHRGEVEGGAVGLQHERPREEARALWDLFTRDDDEPARREGRALGKVGAEPAPARQVALGAEDAFGLRLQVARVGGARGVVVDQEEDVLRLEREPLQLVGGRLPVGRRLEAVEVGPEVVQRERRERALEVPGLGLDEQAVVDREEVGERRPVGGG